MTFVKGQLYTVCMSRHKCYRPDNPLFHQAMEMRLRGLAYGAIALELGVSRQRIHQIIAPPREIREGAIKRFAGKCAACGATVGQRGHVHHEGRDNKPENYNKPENLELLCIGCHLRRHAGDRTPTNELSMKQRGIMEFLCQFIDAKQYPPTVREVQTALNLSTPSLAHYHLGVLEERGYIRRERFIARGLEVVGRTLQ